MSIEKRREEWLAEYGDKLMARIIVHRGDLVIHEHELVFNERDVEKDFAEKFREFSEVVISVMHYADMLEAEAFHKCQHLWMCQCDQDDEE